MGNKVICFFDLTGLTALESEGGFSYMNNNIYIINQSYGDGREHLKEELGQSLNNTYGVTIFAGRNGNKQLKKHECSNGLEIYRISNSRMKRTILGRLTSYVSFIVGAFWKALKIKANSTVIVTTQPPFVAYLVTLFKRMKRLKILYNVQDLYPDVLVALGKKASEAISIKLVRSIQTKTIMKSDRIVVIGESMKDRIIREYKVGSDRVSVIENWGMKRLENIVIVRSNVSSRIRLLYTGNLGETHEIDTLLGAMRILADTNTKDSFCFRFVGLGSNFVRLKRVCTEERLTIAEFSDPVSEEDLVNEYMNSDISLVISNKAIEGILVPSKFYTAVLFNPVVFIGGITDTPAQHIINGDFGYVLENGDSEGLVRILNELRLNNDQLQSMRSNAKAYYYANLSSSIRIAQWKNLIDELSK